MIRLSKEEADQLFQGKEAREIYEIVRARVEAAPDAKIQDLFETLDWVVKNGYATAEKLEAVEEENS
jgi:hypothetical protein